MLLYTKEPIRDVIGDFLTPKGLAHDGDAYAIVYYFARPIVHEETGNPIISYHILATLADAEDEYITGNFDSKPIRDKIRKIFPTIGISSFSFTGIAGQGSPRTVDGLELPDTIIAALAALDNGEYDSYPRVNIRTGVLLTPKKDREIRESQRAIAKTLSCNALSLKSKTILDYYNNQAPNKHNRISTVITIAKQSVLSGTLEDTKKKEALRVLDHIEEQRQQFYITSPKQHTVRPIPYNAGLATIKREARQVITEQLGWIEYDIKSAHAAIFCSIVDVPEFRKVLTSEKGLWNYLFEAFDLPYSENTKEYVFKKAMYQVLNGGSWRNIRDEMSRRFKKLGINRSGDTMLSLEPIREVLVMRDNAYQRIRDDKGARLISGEWIPFDGKSGNDTKSILAQQMQAIELEVIFEAYKIAIQFPKQITIPLYQFDGFHLDISNKERAALWESRIEYAVNDKLQALDIPTKLVKKAL